MADKEPFEIVPKKEVDDLKKDVRELKENPLGASSSGNELIKSVGNLTQSMDNMFELFKVANKEIKEEASTLEFIKKITPLFDNLNKKLDRLTEQHDKIAEGVVAVAEMVKEIKDRKVPLIKHEEEKPAHDVARAPSPSPRPRSMAPPPSRMRPAPGRPPIAPPR
ncbi:hypothetical protein ISS04_02940 [Candidatus Woesearchaeota archaeon]|nr:hypothetical protein [Candidatus Woesearchaeota archaeon]